MFAAIESSVLGGQAVANGTPTNSAGSPTPSTPVIPLPSALAGLVSNFILCCAVYPRVLGELLQLCPSALAYIVSLFVLLSYSMYTAVHARMVINPWEKSIQLSFVLRRRVC